MRGLTSFVLFLFLASCSAIAADAPEPAPPVAAAPPVAPGAPKSGDFLNVGAALDDQLFRAVTDGKADEVLRLVNAGANPNTPSGADRKRALNVAAAAGNKKIVEILIAASADVNAHDGAGDSPLIAAVRNDKQEVAKLIGAVRTGKITVEDLRKLTGFTVSLPPAPPVAKPAPAVATAANDRWKVQVEYDKFNDVSVASIKDIPLSNTEFSRDDSLTFDASYRGREVDPECSVISLSVLHVGVHSLFLSETKPTLILLVDGKRWELPLKNGIHRLIDGDCCDIASFDLNATELFEISEAKKIEGKLNLYEMAFGEEARAAAKALLDHLGIKGREDLQRFKKKTVPEKSSPEQGRAA